MLFWLNARYFTLAVPLFTEDLVGQSVSQSVTCTAKNIPRVRTVADPDLKQTRRVGSGFVLLALPGFSPFCDFFFYPSPRSASVGEGKTVVKELVTDRTAFRGVVTSNCFFLFVCFCFVIIIFLHRRFKYTSRNQVVFFSSCGFTSKTPQGVVGRLPDPHLWI